MSTAQRVEVVIAHDERATLRVGDVFLKVDAAQHRRDIEVRAMAAAPVPTPNVLWHHPPVLALARVAGRALGRLGRASSAGAGAWRAAGAAARMLHAAPLPTWQSGQMGGVEARLELECAALTEREILPAPLVAANREVALRALRPYDPVFVHGDLQPNHVFVEGGAVRGIIDWSEAGQGDALFDLATLTLGHEEHLDDVLAGYGTAVDVEVVRAWWSLRGLLNVRWLKDHGFDPWQPGAEVDVLRAAARR